MTFTIIQTQRTQLKSFKSAEQLNESIRAYLYKFKKQFHNANTHYSELNAIGKVFKVLYTHSVKCPGVAYLSNKNIAKLADINIRTVKRATNKLQELGIIIKTHTKRENGSDSANTYVIKPMLSSIIDKLFKRKKGHDHPTQPPLESESFKQKKSLKDINVTVDVNQLGAEFTSSYVPSEFRDTVKPFFNNAKTIEKFYWKFKNAVDQQNEIYEKNYTTVELMNIAIEAFRQTIRKRKKIKGDLFNYYFGVCGFMLDEYRFQQQYDFLNYDWLEE